MIVAWTMEDTVLYGRVFSADDASHSRWADIAAGDLLPLAEYTENVRYLSMGALPDGESVLFVTTNPTTREMIVGITNDLDETIDLETVPDVTVQSYSWVMCTSEDCFVGFMGTYQEIEGIHVVPIGDLTSSSR